MSILANLRQAAKQRPQRIIFSEQDDPRVFEAVIQLAKENICIPIFLSTPVQTIPENLNIEIYAKIPNHQDWQKKAIQFYLDNDKKGRLSNCNAKQAISNPLLLSALLVSVGYVDGGVAGAIATTPQVLRACIKGIGIAKHSQTVSSIFLMELENQTITYADCAVNPSPTSEQLAEIAIDSAHTHCKLTGEQARVAMLSFSTHGSAEHEETIKIVKATRLAKAKQPSLIIDGELQFDAAFVPSIAASKAPDSCIAGNANVFIFPDLNAGNIAYKITERIAQATAIGPILQGLAKPFLDLSRGCSKNDIIDAAVIVTVLANKRSV